MNPLELFYIVLVEPKNPENIGAVARVMKNFGIYNLVLVNPRCELGQQAYITATHAAEILEGALIVDSLKRLRPCFSYMFATSGRISLSSKKKLRKFISPKTMIELLKRSVPCPVAIVFGREESGLKNEEIAICDHLVHIPANPEFPVLNLSHAVAVICYELFAAFGEIPAEKLKLAAPEAKYLLVKKLLQRLKLPDHAAQEVEKVLLRLPVFDYELGNLLRWINDIARQENKGTGEFWQAED
ncbi:MAG: RNA methyltransferase [bacterium]|nr:RNA methyltransferase [bacterium]